MTAHRAIEREQFVVALINGHRPVQLDEFTEAATITLAREELTYRLTGIGSVTTTGDVRFRPTAHTAPTAPTAQHADVAAPAVWLISDGGGGNFYAEPAAAF